MNESGAEQITKIAAAQRQLDAAIRIFFQREDELAIHTLVAAAFQVLRDITKARGGHFTGGVYKGGTLSIAKQYLQGTLSSNEKAIIEGSSLMPTITELVEHIRVHGEDVDEEWVEVNVPTQHERKLWLAETTNFLKHADRDPDDLLSTNALDNGKMLMGACAAYLELMKQPTPEIKAYVSYLAAQVHAVDDLAEDVQLFARQLEAADENRRYEMCSEFIRDHKPNGVS